MPRKKDPSRQTFRRSHHGCQRCRLHKIRCDEVKPHCGPCSNRGYSDCNYLMTLKWESDYKHVGRAFGRTGVWSKASSPGQTGQSPRADCQRRSSSPLQQSQWNRVTHVHGSGFLNLFTHDFEDEVDERHDPLILVAPKDMETTSTAVSLRSPSFNKIS